MSDKEIVNNKEPEGNKEVINNEEATNEEEVKNYKSRIEPRQVKRKRLCLIDGFAIIFKSYYAMIHNPLSNYKGESVSGLLGFIRSVLQVLKYAQMRGCNHVGMVLDSGGKTFRNELDPNYKANRLKPPEDLIIQIGYLRKILETWGIPTFAIPGYEADDIIATLARRAAEEDIDCQIVTNDKDLYQLINDRISILRPAKGDMRVHKAEYCIEKWGIPPSKIRSYLAIAGDHSDNVGGVVGIGQVGASALLKQYDNLDAIYADIENLQLDRFRKRLIASHEAAYLSYELVGLADRIPELCTPPWEQIWEKLELSSETITGKKGKVNEPFGKLLMELGLNRLAEEFYPGIQTQTNPGSTGSNSLLAQQNLALLPPGTQQKEDGSETSNNTSTDEEAEIRKTTEEVLESYECVTTEAQLQTWCARIRKTKYVAVDTETTGLNELKDELIGISLCTQKNQACYIPLKAPPPSDSEPESPPPELLDPAIVRKALQECLQADVKVIGQNFKFDYKVLANWKLDIPNIYFDTMIAAWLLGSTGGISMDELAKRYLGIEVIHFNDIVKGEASQSKKSGSKKASRLLENKSFADVPLDLAVRYAAEDADITWQLYEIFEPLLKERRFEELFYKLEMPLVKILGNMELRGISCSRKDLKNYSEWLKKEIEKTENSVRKLSKQKFNLNSPIQLGEVLFKKLNLPAGKKNRSGYSTENSVLEKLRDKHPIIAPILKHRHLNKLYATYVKPLPEMILDRTGRIHPHFSVIGTETGRLNCKDPNLQNIPIKDAEGLRIRAAFQPEPGWGYLSGDYSQVELVVLAHLSKDKALCEAFRSGRDIHRETASRIFAIPLDRVSDERRRIAKSINFGVIYGMRAYSLALEIGVSRVEAKQFIEAYFREFSGVKNFIAETIANATERGFVKTLLGREREIRLLRSNNSTQKSHGERMAVNTVVQGSAADIVKKAMILVTTELQQKKWEAKLLLQIHDELIFEAPKTERELLENLVLDTMETAYELDIPLRVNLKWTSESWGQLH